jgi:DNA-binding transcriptional LysR family regulator
MTPIELRHLRHFVAVAEAGSFHGAAKAVHLSQPAVTKSIQRLEGWFGHKLFERGTKVELTGLGRLLLGQAQRTLLSFNDLRHEAGLYCNADAGELTIGAGPLMAEGIVGPAVGCLLARHPLIRVTVQVENFAHFPERLRKRDLDFFVADVSAIESDPEFEIRAIPPQEGIWFCRPTHPLARRRSVTLREFFNYPIVLPMLPAWLDAWFARHHPKGGKAGPFRPALVCSHFSTLKAVVRHSDAISGAIPAALAQDLRDRRFVALALSAPKVRAKAGIVWMRGRSLPPAALALISEVERLAEETSHDAPTPAPERRCAPPPCPEPQRLRRRR